MRISAELSLYPLRDDYKKTINGYIDLLERTPNLTVIQHPLSTEIHGEYDVVFAAVQDATRKVFDCAQSSEKSNQDDSQSMHGVVLIAKYVNKIRATDSMA